LRYYFLHGIIVDVEKEKAFNLYKEAVEGGNETLALLFEKWEDK
jgi:TPR repeat protein